MWCPSCRAEVAAELSTDNRRMLCARCQTELGITSVAASQILSQPRTAETERDARELLARWSAQSMLDVPAPAVGTGSFAKPVGSIDLPAANSDVRFDSARSDVRRPSVAFMNAIKSKQDQPAQSRSDESNAQTGHETPRKKKSRTSRIDDVANHSDDRGPAKPQTVSQTNGAHVDSEHEHEMHLQETYHHQPPRHQASWMMMAGQICAYAGVGLLTCGTVLVMWHYFGGPPRFLPMGWLTAAVGQMLLFLGVITLISNGMDQAIKEVGWRIDFLAEEIHHMEMALDELEAEHRKARRKRIRRKDRPSNGDQSRTAA